MFRNNVIPALCACCSGRPGTTSGESVEMRTGPTSGPVRCSVVSRHPVTNITQHVIIISLMAT